MTEQEKTQVSVDVIVVGGSIVATITALALSAQGVSVAVIDKGVHPRFALGESLLKPTVLWMRMLAERFAVPELNVLANVEKINKQISPTSGVKKCFGFVQHDPGSSSIRDQWWSNLAVSYGEQVSEAHLFRQDVDSYLFHAAARKCDFVISGTAIKHVNITKDRVNIALEKVDLIGRFVVDCTGARSLLANQYKHRESPTRYRSASRTIFTHMINVKPFDECGAAPVPAINWHEGTLHHLLDDAWIWVIPFDNHRNSTNPLVSVGVTFHGKNLPTTGESAEQEWAKLLSTYPLLTKQFGDSRAVRPWISTGVLQYSSTSSIGERYCLVGASYGGIDALFSRGLLNSMQSIYLVTELLVDAVRQNSFEQKRFQPVETLQSQLLEINDLLTYGFYCCKDSSALKTWWLVIWIFVEQNSISHAQSALSSCLPNSEDTWNSVRAELKKGVAISNEGVLLPVLQSAVTTLEQYNQLQLSEVDARDKLSIICEPLASIGFNYPQYSLLLNKTVFHPQARVLMQVEYALASVVDDIDKGMDFGGSLRSTPLVMCIIKLIAFGAAARARQKSDLVDTNRSNSLAGNALQEKLVEMAEKWLPDVSSRNAMMELGKLLKSIRYSEWKEHDRQGAVAQPASDWITLLATSDNGRQTLVHVLKKGSNFELKVETRQADLVRRFECAGQWSLFERTGITTQLADKNFIRSGDSDSRQTAA